MLTVSPKFIAKYETLTVWQNMATVTCPSECFVNGFMMKNKLIVNVLYKYYLVKEIDETI